MTSSHRQAAAFAFFLTLAAFSRNANANCGPGSFNVTSTVPYLCGTESDGTKIWGSRDFCYIQFCDEDAVPAYRNSCSSHINCAGQPPLPPNGLCGVPSCQTTVTDQCKQVCDETCGNAIDDNGDGRVDEGCHCDGNEAGCCESQMGHPVSLESGAVATDPIEDFVLPTPGMSVSVERTWISSSPDAVAPRAGFGKRLARPHRGCFRSTTTAPRWWRNSMTTIQLRSRE